MNTNEYFATRFAIDGESEEGMGPVICRGVVRGAKELSRQKQQVTLDLYAQATSLDAAIPRWRHQATIRIGSVILHCHEAASVVPMSIKVSDGLLPTWIESSSLGMAFAKAQQSDVHGVITNGHSGVAMKMAMDYLGLLPGMSRPALIALLPQLQKVILDVGASLSSNKQVILENVLKGAVYFRLTTLTNNPKVGFMAIGEEPEKASPQYRKAAETLRSLDADFTFVGNVEGNDLFTDKADVLVGDADNLNVLIKGVEGAVRFVARELRQAFLHPFNLVLLVGLLAVNPLLVLGFLLAKLHDVYRYYQKYRQLHPKYQPSALLIGVRKLCWVGHGKTTEESVAATLLLAHRAGSRDALISHLRLQLYPLTTGMEGLLAKTGSG